MKIANNARLAGITVIALATLTACGGEDASDIDATMEMDAGAGTAPVEGAAPAAPAPGPVTVNFEPLGDFLAEGAVTIRRDGATIRVDVLADSHLGPGDYPMHIHEGTCEEGGRVVASLTTMTGGEGGEGSTTTTLPAEQLPLDGTYFIQMHQIDGTPIACGDAPPLTNL